MVKKSRLYSNTSLFVVRVLGYFLDTLSALLPDGRVKTIFKLSNFGHRIGIYNADMTCKSLEAFLEASLQIQLQLYAYFHGYNLGIYHAI